LTKDYTNRDGGARGIPPVAVGRGSRTTGNRHVPEAQSARCWHELHRGGREVSGIVGMAVVALGTPRHIGGGINAAPLRGSLRQACRRVCTESWRRSCLARTYLRSEGATGGI